MEAMPDSTSGTLRCLNPFTQEVSVHQIQPENVCTLHTAAIRTIQNALTLHNFNKIELLPLPQELKAQIGQLQMTDFWINPDQVSVEQHRQRNYPATCLLDQSQVFLQLKSEVADGVIVEDPAYLTHFDEGHTSVLVLSVTQTLHELLARARATRSHLPEPRVWHVLNELAESMLNSGATSSQFHPKHFHLKDGRLFYRHAELPTMNDTQAVNSTGLAIYEAPEILMRQGETPTTSTWVFGCMAYEIASLDPAYYDHEGSGNVMAIMMAITQGVLPSRIPVSYSEELWELIASCLTKDSTTRPTLLDIQARISVKLPTIL